MLAQTFDEFLLGFVDALGNQVLGPAGRSFLSGFFTTRLQGTLDQRNTISIDRIGQTAQNTEGCKRLERAGDDTQSRCRTPLIGSSLAFFCTGACLSSASANT